MSEGTRVILRTMNGPPGKDGEVTLERLATELEPYAKQSDLLAEATRVDNLVQGQGTLLDLVNNGRLSPGGVATAARAATTRGTLPSGTDLNTLDTLGGADEAGAWLMSGSYTYGNQPPRTPGATAVLEVVVANAYTGIIQRVTESSGATWARNKVSTGAGAWTTWRRMDPHVDTTVGTRVFVGDVMIYGDTGWRALCRWSGGEVTEGTLPTGMGPAPISSGGVFVRRVNDAVTLATVEARALQDNPTVSPSPSGFRGNSSMPYPAVPITYTTDADEVRPAVLEVGVTIYRYRGVPAGASIAAPGSGGYGVQATWLTDTPWPSSLPGTPA